MARTGLRRVITVATGVIGVGLTSGIAALAFSGLCHAPMVVKILLMLVATLTGAWTGGRLANRRFNRSEYARFLAKGAPNLPTARLIDR